MIEKGDVWLLLCAVVRIEGRTEDVLLWCDRRGDLWSLGETYIDILAQHPSIFDVILVTTMNNHKHT